MSWSYQLRTQRLSADWNQGLTLVYHHQFFDGYRMNSTAENYHQNSGNTGCTAASNQCAQCDTAVLLLTLSHSLCHSVKQGHCSQHGPQTWEFTSLPSGGQGKQNPQSWNQSQAGMDTFRGKNKRPSTCTGTAQNVSYNLEVAQAQTICRVLI